LSEDVLDVEEKEVTCESLVCAAFVSENWQIKV